MLRIYIAVLFRLLCTAVGPFRAMRVQVNTVSSGECLVQCRSNELALRGDQGFVS